jgi:hypothetical protein
MRDVIAPLYAQLIIMISNSIESNLKIRFNSSPAIESSALSFEAFQSMRIIQQESVPENILSLLPFPCPPAPWDTVTTSLIHSLRHERFLFTRIDKGKFISPSEAFVMTEEEGFFDVKNNLKTKPIKETKQGSDKSLFNLAPTSRLESLLLMENLPIVIVPPMVLRNLIDIPSGATEVKPEFIRQHFTQPRALFPSILTKSNLSSSEVISNAVYLLQYCCLDITRDSYQLLHNLPLVPLQNGLLGTIGKANFLVAPSMLQPRSVRSILVFD